MKLPNLNIWVPKSAKVNLLLYKVNSGTKSLSGAAVFHVPAQIPGYFNVRVPHVNECFQLHGNGRLCQQLTSDTWSLSPSFICQSKSCDYA